MTTAAMKMLARLFLNCSTSIRHSLVQADLIPQLINTLNPLSLSFAEAKDIHSSLISTIDWALCLATPDDLEQLGIEDHDGQQAVHETVFQQVITPSEQYIRHLCVNRYSLVGLRLSSDFMLLLAWLLELSPYDLPTMNFVVNMSVIPTLPSCLTFFENEVSIWSFLYGMVDAQLEWHRKRGDVRQMWKTVLRMLKMEGFEDAIEAKLHNHKNEDEGGWIVDISIEWNNLLDCSQPSSRDTPFTPRPVSDPTPPDILGRAQHRVRCGSDLKAVRKDSGQMELTRLFLLISTMLTKAAGHFNPKLTQTSNRGRLNTRRTRPPLRLDLVALKSIFSCDSASDHFQHVVSLRGSGQRDDCWPLDEDVPRHSHPTCTLLSDSIDKTVNVGRKERVEAALGRRLFLGRDNRLVGTVNAVREQPAIWTKTISIEGEEHDLLLNHPRFGILARPELRLHHSLLLRSLCLPQNPIGVTASTVVEDEIVRMGGLVEWDEVRPFLTSWKVPELAVDSSDAKYEVQTASGRI
ncbi:hypothetical protein BLNAU_18546 [Blattamonas nauphoetae]|uniref:Uncharacterized protein n=1 Tax=Blattamonas nauphoetae TaxID=2049346 RepID=A0ABQ9X413_9EUKA|nr:hypothetical protein BLNAU_18546 [Blattamonas nauphoetae]